MPEIVKKKVFDLHLLKRVLQFVKPYKKQFYLSIFLGVVLAVFAPIRPYLIQLTIDAATGKAIHIPLWLKALLLNADANDATKFIISVTILQVALL